MRRFFIGLASGVLLFVVLLSGATLGRVWGIPLPDRLFSRQVGTICGKSTLEQRILTEESAVIEVAEKVSPSVVTVSVVRQSDSFDPLSDPFGSLRLPGRGQPATQDRDIGSGFIIDADGLVVTNKHVVDDPSETYRVATKDDTVYEVKKIYRDPTNDLAILKIDPPAGGLRPIELGDSGALKVGQFVIAIGTALGEFRHTVTTGVISGLGRGIQAGDPFSVTVEELDNVIQTDAAINPGNSGGPLLNSAGLVVGANVAIAQGSQNIGFAIPINSVKAIVDNFNKTGQFDRPFFGMRCRVIPKETAILNDVPEGAYVVEIISGSAAEETGLRQGDIITKFDGKTVDENTDSIASLVSQKKIGDTVTVEYWR